MSVSMRVWRCFASLAATVSLGGCLFGSVDPQLRQLEPQVQSITRRVDRLESAVGGASSAASAGQSAALAAPAGTAALEGAGTVSGSVPLAPVFSWRGAMDKLARGVTNLVTGWVEIPKRVHETTTASGAAAGFTWGLLRGAGYGFVRTAAGAYETVTFPFPAPPEYRPVIHPTYVFTDEDGGS